LNAIDAIGCHKDEDCDTCKLHTRNMTYILNWADRRSIGQVILCSSSASSGSNPQGWFNDPSLNVHSKAGIADFQQKLLAMAAGVRDRALAMQSQGVIVWDIDGQKCGPYLGDPRILPAEVKPVAQQFFKTFTDAGLRVGVLIRPQKVNGCNEVDTNDYVNQLKQKVNFAQAQWGCTLFYCDTNVVFNQIIDPEVFRQIAEAYPNSLFVPEWESPTYYQFSAPYNELRMGVSQTDPTLRPGFSVINTADGDFNTYFNQVLDGVRGGDVLLYRAWWDAAENAQVKAIYDMK